MNGAALAGGTTVSFAFNNTQLAAPDLLIINIKSGPASYSSYIASVSGVSAGLAGISLRNITGGSLSEAVVLSFVRSNAEGEIGFLADVRRTNVALTRARRGLVVIGDSATLSNLTFYARLVEYFEAIGAYHTVWEESLEHADNLPLLSRHRRP